MLQFISWMISTLLDELPTCTGECCLAILMITVFQLVRKVKFHGEALGDVGVEAASNGDCASNGPCNMKQSMQNGATDDRPRPGGVASDASRSSSWTYHEECLLASGTFSNVYRARVVESDEVVAIKKVRQGMGHLRGHEDFELQIMNELHHPNVVELRHSFYTSGEEKDETYLNIVMEYYSDTIRSVMKHYSDMRQAVPLDLLKIYMYQMCRSLAYIHALGICHRDVKPQNLLVDGRSHAVKLCDFGSAKKLVKKELNATYICSRYYRAPELMFGASEYSTSIDIWSAGCVSAELFLERPAFPGDSGVDQLERIIKVLGTPTQEELLAMNPNYTDFKFPQIKPQPWSKIFRPRTPQDAIDFVDKFLRYDPKLRPNGIEACAHHFFDELRDQSMHLTSSRPLPELFNFCKEELQLMAKSHQAEAKSHQAEEIMKKLVPEWFRSQGAGHAYA